jgi:hypothetical protein
VIGLPIGPQNRVVPRAGTMGRSNSLGTINLSCRANPKHYRSCLVTGLAVLFGVVPLAANRAMPVWNTIHTCTPHTSNCLDSNTINSPKQP